MLIVSVVVNEVSAWPGKGGIIIPERSASKRFLPRHEPESQQRAEVVAVVVEVKQVSVQ